MKKFREITVLSLKIAAALLISFFCLLKTAAVKEAVGSAITRCLTVVIPSLYGMMIVSGLLVKSGLIGKFSWAVNKPGRFLFGMSGSVFPIFLFSMFAGYPVGAKMLCAEAEKGNILRKDAEIFSGVCFGAGPAFIFGCISSQLYGSPSAGKLILISTVTSNILLAVILSFKMRKNTGLPALSGKIHLSSDVLTGSILDGGRSMADICIMITAFSVFTVFLKETGTLHFVSEIISNIFGAPSGCTEGLLCTFLDVTAVSGLPHNNYEILPAVCALTSFGGVCVIMQINAVTSGRLSICPLIALRTAASLLSAVICRILMPFFLARETVSAADMNVSVHQAASPVPSLLLILMTVILFGEYEKLNVRTRKF